MTNRDFSGGLQALQKRFKSVSASAVKKQKPGMPEFLTAQDDVIYVMLQITSSFPDDFETNTNIKIANFLNLVVQVTENFREVFNAGEEKANFDHYCQVVGRHEINGVRSSTEIVRNNACKACEHIDWLIGHLESMKGLNKKNREEIVQDLTMMKSTVHRLAIRFLGEMIAILDYRIYRFDALSKRGIDCG